MDDKKEEVKKDILKVMVRDRQSLIYEGECYAVSSINEVGAFDVLVEHANFVAIIKEKLTLHFSKISSKELDITTGILRAKENSVEVYLGI